MSPTVVYKFASTTTVYCAVTATGGGIYDLKGDLSAIRLP